MWSFKTRPFLKKVKNNKWLLWLLINVINVVQYSKTAVILLNTTNRINTQETDVISLHFALRVILNIQINRNLTFTLKTLWFVNFIIRSHSRKWKKSEREPWCINFVYVIIFITKNTYDFIENTLVLIFIAYYSFFYLL